MTTSTPVQPAFVAEVRAILLDVGLTDEIKVQCIETALSNHHPEAVPEAVPMSEGELQDRAEAREAGVLRDTECYCDEITPYICTVCVKAGVDAPCHFTDNPGIRANEGTL